MGLNCANASRASCLFFTATIFGMSCDFTSFLKPSKTITSASSLKGLIMSSILKCDVSPFLMVAISLAATVVVMTAPAFVCRHVSFPSVSIVKFFWETCFTVATL